VRLWSLHPRYFDRQALTACWREALLAQAVIEAPAKGYGRHPQLERFRSTPRPADAISQYLSGIADEADARGYRFDRVKIAPYGVMVDRIPVAIGQLQYEWWHLTTKLERRSPEVAALWEDTRVPQPHPLFMMIDGPVASWERRSSTPGR
jgi:hypothetical protein